MTRTIIGSANRDLIIGFDQPFCVIGERINPTGRETLATEMKAGNMDTVRADVISQIEAGANVLDINAGIPLANEAQILADTIEFVQSMTDIPLSIDSSIIEALEKGLSVYKGRALLNSVTGEEENLERILPLVKKYDCAVVAISNDETGISMDPDVRFEVAKKIVRHAQDYGIKLEDVIVDPLVMPIGAVGTSGRSALDLIVRLRRELKVNTTCGASNVSFGLPNRHGINASFLSMAIGAGMTAAIMNPCHKSEMDIIRGADVIAGNDKDCANWIKRFRKPTVEGVNSARGGRTSRRKRG